MKIVVCPGFLIVFVVHLLKLPLHLKPICVVRECMLHMLIIHLILCLVITCHCHFRVHYIIMAYNIVGQVSDDLYLQYELLYHKVSFHLSFSLASIYIDACLFICISYGNITVLR